MPLMTMRLIHEDNVALFADLVPDRESGLFADAIAVVKPNDWSECKSVDGSGAYDTHDVKRYVRCVVFVAEPATMEGSVAGNLLGDGERVLCGPTAAARTV